MVASNVTDLVVNQYIRQPVPVNKDGMDTYLSGQLQEIENSMKTIGEGSIQVADAAPARPLKGMVRYAVSPWNPIGGSFQGLVVYSGTTWLRASDPEGSVSSLTTDLSNLSANLSTNYYTKVTADAAIASATTDLVSTTELTNELGNYTNTATLNQNFYTKTDADSAIASATVNLVSTTDLTNELGDYTNTATLNQNFYTKTDTDTAIATATTNLSTSVGNTYATITNTTASIDGIEAKNTIKIDNNGHISGYGLISTANDGTPTSTFNVAADAFKLGYADSGGTAQTTIPFAHYNNSRTVDGVTVPAGTYIENAFITAANIKTLDVDVINLDGVTLDTSNGELIVKSGGIGTSQIGNGAVSSVISVTASDASITTSDNYLNKVTILDEDVTGLGTTGKYLVTVQAYHDGISEEDSFGRIQLYIDNSLAAEAITGARASGGDVVFSMPAALSASGSTSTGSVNFQVKAYSRRYNSDTIAAHNFEYRSIRLSVAGLKK